MVTRDDLEAYLAELMTNGTRAAEAFERAGIPRPDRVSLFNRVRDEQSGLWMPLDIGYFGGFPKVGEETVANVATKPAQRVRFALHLWPDYELGVFLNADGCPYSPHFVRRADVPLPTAAAPLECEPWAWTLEEVLARFGEPDSDEGWDFRRWLAYPSAQMTFDLGLLQIVEPRP